jgi:hypothetical protein
MSKKRLNKNEIAVRFAQLVDLAENKNREIKKAGGDVRFMPMQQKRKDRLQDFGLYDYVTKRYTLGSIHGSNAPTILNEMQKMLESS